MQTITKFIVLLIIATMSMPLLAQESEQELENSSKIELLEKQRERIKEEERELLKAEVEAINQRLERGEISQNEADRLKKKAAEKRAKNIENRLAIVDNKIALLKRNSDERVSNDEDPGFTIRLGNGDEEDSFLYIGSKKRKPRKYDRRTTSDLVLAFGLNNVITEGQSFDDTPYKIGGSRFFEIGWAWKTRVFKNSNFMRIKYGWSVMINGLKPTDNQYFVQDGNVTTLETFPLNLKKSKLSVSNLVFPVHFEFGPSKKIERDTYFRYSTRNQFKIGVGGFAGFNIGTRQKLKYTQDGDRVKDKIKRSFNTSNFVYGLSTYVAFGDTALYVKYDLNPLFKDQAFDQNNISVGLRFDVD